MKLIKSFLFFLAIICLGCITPKGTFYRGFDINKVEVLAVGEIKPYANYLSSGEMVKNLVIEHLLKRGYTVKEEESGDVEYVLIGAITKFLPEKKYLVYTNKEQQVIINSPLTEVKGSYVYNIGKAFGIPDSEIIATNSTVGVSLRLIDKKNGNVVWTSSFVYEALTVETAADTVVNYLITSLTGKKIK